ncbi:hypothetical protein WICMUC_002951 [Wickerhamomyces mucosus]|uniref:Ubiquitin carboxyl-terminal hydrolase n=1 Tax=Wickerhamomyces mucosus TaxID=1378264 RepID=A0A9P8TE19_9ASCO|nr:hypothetical protein WICMUC_002951 [Wickerhamomyces mucosus]
MSGISSRPMSPDTPATTTTPSPRLSQTYADDLNLKSCSHISQVLNSNARETVLRNYGLAFRIVYINKLSTLKFSSFRDSKGKIEKSKILRLRTKCLKCTDCSNHIDKNFICLQCPHVGCWYEGHFVNHAKLSGHIFGIDSHTGYLFCFKCSNYVHDPQLERMRESTIESFLPNKKVKIANFNDEDLKLVAKFSKSNNGKSSTGLRGFVNMGSTCFMSCILQTIIHNPLIRDYFMSGAHSNCPKNKTECITCCMGEIFTNFYTVNDKKGYGPVSFLNAAWRKNKLLAGYSQQDAHEFWQFLVNQLQQDMEKESGKHLNPESCSCAIHESFSSDLQSSIKCLQCGTFTRTIDPIIDISLDIVHSDDLYGCLANFTRSEKLDIKYNCSTCGERTNATKKLSLLKFPNILSIQLKRFEHSNQSVKLERFIKFPFFLDMNKFSTPYMISKNVDPTLNYELYAVVCHIGTVNTGHYITFIKDNQGQWYKFDDSIVTAVIPEQVAEIKAYLLFYIVNKLA